ncbi:MaoC family dehydratase N-terminal domain-containing protein [Roseomonas sp. BN140053]|uniref:FAS1-like dehydratase domain-containing protein n=1 Tax=Roseomonas sp. BN140053 TaxID=3391898 RepID=UPI0039E998F9
MADTREEAETLVGMGLDGWIGRARESMDELTAPAMRRLAATLDRPGLPLEHGSPVPPHWLAVLFDDAAPQSRLGPDGHAEKGDFLPPVPLPRRMLAGRRMAFQQPARIGDRLTRRSEITAIVPKHGRSGRLIFVSLRHTTTGPRGVVAVEEQDIAYREAVRDGAAPPPPVPEPDPAPGEWEEGFDPDPVLLFRYSALTFNGHRIHYDADYARDVEGYPALVVNGGLSTMMLLEAAARRAGSLPLRGYAARTAKPLFAGRRALLRGTAPDAEGRAALRVVDAGGATALRIDAEYGA